ncbi:MAG: sterol desaturase family protein [Bacteroidetes bacterium]|nr:sterol desaturase family protein [Bacteroidota bacterium]
MIAALPVQVCLGLAILKVTDFNLIHQSGLVHLSWFVKNNAIGFQCLVAFIALDFLEYVYHVSMHKFKRLWMIHLVHHSDEVVDVSTTLREHPLETFIRLTYLLLFLYLTGTEYWMLMLRQAIQIVSNVFSHANLRLPDRLGKILGYIFITPNLHHVHHHYEQPYTNKNYGDVFSIWDRLFGTYANLEKEKIIFGVDTFQEIGSQTKIVTLLKIPFWKYRPAVRK